VSLFPSVKHAGEQGMVGHPINKERRYSPPRHDRRFDCEIATAMLAVAWSVILWRLLHPAMWSFAIKAMHALRSWPAPKGWPSWDVVVTVLYGCVIGFLWWAPLRHAARYMRREAGRPAVELEQIAGEALRNPGDFGFSVKLSLFGKQSEVDMRHAMIGLALLNVAFAPSVAAQPQSWSSSNARTLVASGELPIVSAMPLYFRVIGATISSGEENGFAAGNGVLYQISGATELVDAGTARTIKSGEGAFIPGGSRLTLRAFGDEASTYLYFMVSPASYLDEPHLPPGSAREIYRSATAISNLRQGTYLLNLSRVTLPAFAPADLPHHRSGAALHYVLSGFGAETANGLTIAKGSGSISYEPDALVYQWGNPGYPPLTYLVFNLNPDDEDAIVAVAAVNDQN
jgi:hypothetical protein